MVDAIALVILGLGAIALVASLVTKPKLTIFIVLYGIVITASLGLTARFVGTSPVACLPIIAFPIVYALIRRILR